MVNKFPEKFMSFRRRRNHTSTSTKIGDFLCGVSCVISPFGRNDNIVFNRPFIKLMNKLKK
jgi:hypothetical protein